MPRDVVRGVQVKQVSVSASKCCTVRFPFVETNALLISSRFRLLHIYSFFQFFPSTLNYFHFFFQMLLDAADIYFLQFFNSLISPISNLFLLSFTTGIYVYSPFGRKIIRLDRVHQQIVAKRADYFNNVMYKIILARRVSISF